MRQRVLGIPAISIRSKNPTFQRLVETESPKHQ